ncbi:MAG: type II toxin-antitoxin system Phd/YefM family antitoxin [Bryobacteraceae bacterium]
MTIIEAGMAQFNIAEAKARFSELVERALAGDEVVVARDNKPLLKLVPLADGAVRKPGSARGQVRMSKDFDKPLADFENYR